MNNQQELSVQIFSLPGVRSVLKRSWKIYKVRLWTFLGIISLPLIFSFLLFFTSIFIKKINLILSIFHFIFILLFFLLIIFIIFWSQVSLLFAIKGREEKIGIKESYKRGWSKIISYFWISVLGGFIILGGLFLFFIPGVIFFIWFSLAPYILVSEDLKGFSALIRSRQYVKGYWWKIFWRFLIIGMIWFLVFLIIEIIILLPFFLSSGEINKEINNFISRTTYLILMPFFVTCYFLIYEDLKRIKGNILFEPPSRGTKIKYILIGTFCLLIIPVLLIASIVLVSLNKTREKIKEIGVMTYMFYIQTKIEMIYSEQKKYSGLNCEFSDLAYFCDEIKNQIGEKPIIQTSIDNYCFYVKLPSGDYYCLDSQMKPSKKISIFPGQSGYCDGITFNCP